jgi:hypothetical protein
MKKEETLLEIIKQGNDQTNDFKTMKKEKKRNQYLCLV